MRRAASYSGAALRPSRLPPLANDSLRRLKSQANDSYDLLWHPLGSPEDLKPNGSAVAVSETPTVRYDQLRSSGACAQLNGADLEPQVPAAGR
jgi:hypothetical protein